MTLALEIAATPFGCGHDRTSALWNARSDVTAAEVDNFRNGNSERPVCPEFSLSYRSKDPLRVIGEVIDWQGHSADELNHMKANVELARLRGVEAIEE